MTIARFPLGQVVSTPGALDALLMAGQTPAAFLRRHLAGDWGEVDDHDRRENERSLADGCRLLSAYTLATGEKLWLITEADRSSTTILLRIGILMALSRHAPVVPVFFWGRLSLGSIVSLGHIRSRGETVECTRATSQNRTLARLSIGEFAFTDD
jgi:hypothetical protein